MNPLPDVGKVKVPQLSYLVNSVPFSITLCAACGHLFLNSLVIQDFYPNVSGGIFSCSSIAPVQTIARQD